MIRFCAALCHESCFVRIPPNQIASLNVVFIFWGDLIYSNTATLALAASSSMCRFRHESMTGSCELRVAL